MSRGLCLARVSNELNDSAFADVHQSSVVQEDLAREHRRRVDRLEYDLITSSSQMRINTEAGRPNPAQEEVDDHIFHSYYKENVKKVNSFSIHRGQERVHIVFEGTDRDFLETIKHGGIGTFCIKPLHFFTILNVEYQQLAPTGDMVQSFNSKAAKQLDQVQAELRQMVADAENSPEVLRQWQRAQGANSAGASVAGALTKKLSTFLGTAHHATTAAAPSSTAPSTTASTSSPAPGAAGAPSPAPAATAAPAKPRRHDPKPVEIPNGLPAELTQKLRLQMRLRNDHDLCIKPRLGTVPPSRQSRRIFEAVIAVQSRARARHTRTRLRPLMNCLKTCIDEKDSMFLDTIAELDILKDEVEVAERRRVLEEKESTMRMEIIQLHGDIFADYIGMKLRYVPREESLLRKGQVSYVEERHLLEFIEEDFYRRRYFAVASAYTRLLVGAVSMQHTEQEKRGRLVNIEISDRQKIKTFYQNSYLQILQAQQSSRKTSTK